MTTQNSNTATNGGTAKKVYTNVGIKYRGFLQHDNKYFDRTCPSCGGLFCSYTSSTCPKCLQPLTFITAPSGNPMGISEGTFRLLLSEKTKERLERNLTSHKDELPIKYRFKMYSFMDDNGVLAPIPEHAAMKNGAIVEMIIINHPAEAKPFYSKKYQRQCLQLMHHIFTGYGDSVKVVRAPKAKAESTIAYNVDAAGNPVPVAPPFGGSAAGGEALADMQKRLAAMQAQMDTMIKAGAAPAPAPVPQKPAAPAPEAVKVAAADAADEFYGAEFDEGALDEYSDEVVPF